MSFFSSLQEYVTNSVAGLSLSPKRFSLSRTDTTENSLTASSTGLPVSPGGSRSASGDSNTPGFPKVLPSPGLSPLQPNNRRRTLECLVPAPPVRRPGGSFRQRNPKPPITPTTERSSFCCRRLSWPDIDHQIQSGIQEVDGAYFESFPTLAWKQENKRQSVQRAASEAVASPASGDTAGLPVVPHTQGPMAELALGIAAIDYTMSPQEKDKLYVEMLYTIANAVGAPAPGGQYAHYKEDLYLYGQRAFGVPPDRHYRMLHLAGEEKPPIIVLSVIVLEAEGLEAKDANGFSDPYCMLGIQPVAAPSSPQPNTPNRTLSADMCNDNSAYMSHSHSGGGSVGPALSPSSPGSGGAYIGSGVGCVGGNHEKLRKHHSFKLSFKRKEGRSSAREQRDSLTGAALPAKFIRATSVKPHTLNPRWNEKFRFDIDETGSDSLHLDIWDHDDESSVLEAVSKLNEVRGVRGLGRYFKQVCQSARQSSQDDFLGCVTISLQDIPSTGMEGWFKLEARSQRSNVQGRIRLKMWLSTREDHGISEEDNWTELMQHESLYSIFIDYELKSWRKETWTWPGDLPGPALTILHQHAVQGDLSELQAAISHFVSASRVYMKQPLDPKWLLQLLTDIEHAWLTCTLTREEEMWLAESFTSMLERWLLQLRHHRQLFPALHTASLTRLEYVLRSLAYLSNMKSFWKCCPFNKEIRGEIVASLRKGTPEWFLHIRSTIVARCQQQQAQQDYDDSFVDFCAELYLHLQQGLSNYHPLFEGTNGIPYFSVVFKQLDKLLADEVIAFLTDDHHQQSSSHIQMPSPDPAYSRLILAVYLEVKDLAQFSQQLPSGGDHKLLLPRCHEWFEPAVSCWLEVCKSKALHRVRKAVELQKAPLPLNDSNLSRVVRHNSSAVDIVAMFCQLRDFWRLLQWPRAHSVALLSQLLDCVCSAALLYADIVYQDLVETGYFDRAGPYRFSEEMCVAANNLEYVYKFISLLENYFDFITLESLAIEAQYIILTNQLDSTLSQLQTRVLDILQRVGPQMQEALRKSMFHLAWSPDTLPTAEAVQPLFDYLWTNLHQLNMALLGQNFQRVLYEVWEYTLVELDRQTDGGDSTSQGTNAPESLPPLFHDRLHAALDLLLEFFHAEGQGLSVELLRSGQYAHVAQRLQYHRMDTESLVEVFLGQRLIEQQQIMMAGSNIQAIYGVLAVRAYFNHDSLCVEVLHARDIIPLDPNGFSDPFVIIELLPHRVFPHCTEQQTNVHKKTLHPVFDECFEFSVSLEQCRATQAMIGFTVMDHDVLTANDFAGEAFLALGSIPGVTNATGLGVDNFHGLKPVELVLMQQNVKNQQPILQILELRSTDRLAIDFVRKQRLRLSN